MVIDPIARVVTHLVVEPKQRRGLGRLVPLGLVDASSGEISLSCTMAEFQSSTLPRKQSSCLAQEPSRDTGRDKQSIGPTTGLRWEV